MLFKSSICLLVIIYSSVLLIKIHCQNYDVRCFLQDKPVDQGHDQFPSVRKKRFVLFPEFINYLNDPRYIHAPKHFIYWIANFYPNKIDNEIIHFYIKEVIQQINLVLDNEITISTANDPSEANFYFYFFNYALCPTDDPTATIGDNKIVQKLSIYSAKVTQESRYRANGGIFLVENDQPKSEIKLNMQQKFLPYEDPIYDAVTYQCDEKNQCEADLFWVLLHETLHGFGIEHTANHQKPNPPNPKMQSVMHFSYLRFLCHDDIRAIRMVYNLTVKRENAIYDDTCRRDFPLSKSGKSIKSFERFIILGLIIFGIISLCIFILTLIYLLIRYFLGKKSTNIMKKSSPIISKKPIIKIEQKKKKPHGYLWHDDMI